MPDWGRSGIKIRKRRWHSKKSVLFAVRRHQMFAACPTISSFLFLSEFVEPTVRSGHHIDLRQKALRKKVLRIAKQMLSNLTYDNTRTECTPFGNSIRSLTYAEVYDMRLARLKGYVAGQSGAGIILGDGLFQKSPIHAATKTAHTIRSCKKQGRGGAGVYLRDRTWVLPPSPSRSRYSCC